MMMTNNERVRDFLRQHPDLAVLDRLLDAAWGFQVNTEAIALSKDEQKRLTLRCAPIVRPITSYARGEVW